MMQSECREWQHVLNLLHSNMNITTELDAVKASPLAGPYPHPWAMAALCALPWITQRRNNPSQCFTGRWRQTEQDAAAAADVTDSRWDAAAGLYRLTAVGLSCSCSRPVSLSRWDVMVASVTLKPLLLLLLSSAALLSSPPSLRTLIFKGRLKRRDGVFTPESLLCWQRWIIHWCAHHPHIIRTHPSIHPSIQQLCSRITAELWGAQYPEVDIFLSPLASLQWSCFRKAACCMEVHAWSYRAGRSLLGAWDWTETPPVSVPVDYYTFYTAGCVNAECHSWFTYFVSEITPTHIGQLTLSRDYCPVSVAAKYPSIFQFK